MSEKISSSNETKEEFLERVSNDGSLLKYEDKYITDRDVVLAAVKDTGIVLKYTDFKDDREIVKEAVFNQGMSLK